MADLTTLTDAIRQRGQELVRSAERTVLEDTRQVAPVATGATRDSLHTDPFETSTSFGFDITADTDQALWTDEGTRGPYIIRARNAKVLRFFGASGEPVFRRFVTHPGIKAQNWFRQPMGDRFTRALESAP